MSFFAVHLRWEAATPSQYDQLLNLLTNEREGPSECLSHRLHRLGDVVLATAVWESDTAAERFRHRLSAACKTAGLAEPRIAVVAVPAMFLAGYRRPQSTEVPRPRPAESALEQRSGTPVAVAAPRR